MTHLKRVSVLSLVLASFFVFTTVQSTMAGGTPSTQNPTDAITNTAIISYNVGGISQTPVDSETSFYVDKKIDLTVASDDGGYVQVIPAPPTGTAPEYALSFIITNTGNDPQDFALSVNQLSTGDSILDWVGLDSFDANIPTARFYLDSVNDGSYDGDETNIEFIDELVVDTPIRVFVVASIPPMNTATPEITNNAIAGIMLTATAHAGGTSGGTIGAPLTATPDTTANTIDAVDIVFADGNNPYVTTDTNRDASFAAVGAYQIASAMLTITKTSEVIYDPVNTTNNPKAIPGAVVEYTITITNDINAGAPASNISLLDDLTEEIVANSTLAFVTSGHSQAYAGGDISVTLSSGGTTFVGFSGNTISVNGITLNADESATIQFRVVIQ